MDAEGRGRAWRPTPEDLALAVHATRTPLCLSDPSLPDNPITFANRAFFEMTGYSPEEVIGRNCRFLQGPQSDAATVEAIRHAVDGRREISVDLLNYRKDGSSFWNELFISPIFDLGGRLTYFFASQNDVTNRRRVQGLIADQAEELRRVDVRNRALLQLGAELRREADPGRLAEAVARVVGQTLGIDRAVYAGVDFEARRLDIAGQWTGAAVDRVASSHPLEAQGEIFDELALGTPVVWNDAGQDPRIGDWAPALDAIHAWAGISHPIVEDGRVAALLCATQAKPREWTGAEVAFVRDAGELARAAIQRRRAEREAQSLLRSLEDQVAQRTADLQASMGRLQAAFATSFTYQGYLDVEGRVLDANPTALDGIRSTRDQVVGQLYWETPWFAATPGLPEQIQAAVARAAAGQPSRFAFTSDLPTGRHAFDFSLRPVRGAAGEVVALLPEAIETTDRLAAEEALRQSQKMEAVGQLTGGLAHDFNNLLTGVSGSLELIQSRMAQGRLGDVERYVAAAQGAAKRAAALTHRLLAFSRHQTLSPKPTDANRLMGDLVDLIRRTVGPGVEVETVAAAGLWPTLVDPNQLENAILNLCINARDAMPEGGLITIETANRRLDERGARDVGIEPGEYVTLCVSDTGTGMDKATLERVFDPFFTTKPIGQGTGLGLSMVYGFAKQSEGHVRIYSELGQGALVCIYLPRLLAGLDEEPGRAPPARLHETQMMKTVLVVDDEPTVRMLVADALKDVGCACLEAEDGPAGLQILESGARVDLLITDVGLPGGMNGRQVAEAARVLRPALKVLFITGYAENAVLSHGHVDHGMEVLTKPFAMESLGERVQRMLQTA